MKKIKTKSKKKDGSVNSGNSGKKVTGSAKKASKRKPKLNLNDIPLPF